MEEAASAPFLIMSSSSRIARASRQLLFALTFLFTAAAAAPAHAASCWQLLGWNGSGSVGDTALLSATSCAPAPSGSGWGRVIGAPSGTDALYLLVPFTDSHVRGGNFSPLLVFNRLLASGVPEVRLDLITCTGCSNTIPLQYDPFTPPPCTSPITWWNGACVMPRWDGANYYVWYVPSGASAFIYNNSWYIEAIRPGTDCPAGWYDGANCYLMGKPAGGFVYDNSFYAPVEPDGSCAVGTFDGASCYILSAPFGTSAFVYGDAFYTTPRPTCVEGHFDGGSCYLGTPPAGKRAFIWGGNFYYSR